MPAALPATVAAPKVNTAGAAMIDPTAATPRPATIANLFKFLSSSNPAEIRFFGLSCDVFIYPLYYDKGCLLKNRFLEAWDVKKLPRPLDKGAVKQYVRTTRLYVVQNDVLVGELALVRRTVNYSIQS